MTAPSPSWPDHQTLEAAAQKLHGADDLSLNAERQKRYSAFQHQLVRAVAQDTDGIEHTFWFKQFTGKFSVWTHFDAVDLAKREHAASTAARASGLPVPKLIVWPDIADQNDSPVCVSQHIEGRSLRSIPQAHLIKQAATHLQILSRSSINKLPWQNTIPHISLKIFAARIDKIVKQTGDELLQSCQNKLAIVHNQTDPLPACLVHGDCHGGNWLTDGQTITGLLDWEDAIFGDPRFDVAVLYRDLQGYGVPEKDLAPLLGIDYGSAGASMDIDAWMFLINVRDYAASVVLRTELLYGDKMPQTDLSSWLSYGANARDALAKVL